MALYVGSSPIFSHGDFVELMRELPDDFDEPTLTALLLGEPVNRAELRLALNVRVRLAAASDRADEIIDAALEVLDA